MSKVKLDNIRFDDDDFVVEIKPKNRDNRFYTKHSNNKINIPANKIEEIDEIENKKNIVEESKLQSKEIIEKAEIKAKEIINNAQKEIDELQILLEEKKQELEKLNKIEAQAKTKAQEILDQAELEAQELKTNNANIGYEEGYKDAKEKIQEELEEKLLSFDKFFELQKEVEEKILKNTSIDIIKIIQNISSRILTKEIDAEKLSTIIKNTINLFEDKDNINIILSEKYTRMLYELQKKSLCDEIGFDFEDFKQYENFNIVYNSKLDDDTIIIENSKERFDASLKSQLDVIIRNIYENTGNKPFEFTLEELEEKSDNEIN